MKTYIGTKIIKAKPMDRTAVERLLLRDIGGSATGEGYLVEYQDGYQSWSPKDVFEDAYRPMEGMTFGMAIEAMKKGMGARLPQWQSDVVIRAQFPDENSKMTAPYLYVESRFGRVPWKETMIELFSEDWEIVS